MEQGKKEFIYYYPSKIGRMLLSSDGTAITGLWLEGQKYYGATLYIECVEQTLPIFEKAKQWLDLYFSKKVPDFALPLLPKGSPFRQLVWNILCEIPYGRVMTYGEIARVAAKELGKEHMSAQAVGGAVGHNPISVLIPCHRAVGTGGSLTGYAGGIDKKIQLLELEGVEMKGLYRPKKGTAL